MFDQVYPVASAVCSKGEGFAVGGRCLAPWGKGQAVVCNVAFFLTSVTAFQELSGKPPGPMPPVVIVGLWL